MAWCSPTEDVDSSASRQLAEKVDLTRVAHLEQIGVFSDPDRMPGARVMATGFLGLVPLRADPRLPADTGWHPVDDLPPTALDHGSIADRAHRRLQAKLSYTNIGFALAPAEFTIAQLRQVYATALEHDVDPTNLQRILTRRGMLEPTGPPPPPAPRAVGRRRCTGSPCTNSGSPTRSRPSGRRPSNGTPMAHGFDLSWLRAPESSMPPQQARPPSEASLDELVDGVVEGTVIPIGDGPGQPEVGQAVHGRPRQRCGLGTPLPG